MQTNKPFLPYHHTAGQSHVTFSWIMHINHRVQNFVHQHPHTWTTKSEPFTMHNPDLTHQEFIRIVGWRRKSLCETHSGERHIRDTSVNFREDTSDYSSNTFYNSCRKFRQFRVQFQSTQWSVDVPWFWQFRVEFILLTVRWGPGRDREEPVWQLEWTFDSIIDLTHIQFNSKFENK